MHFFTFIKMNLLNYLKNLMTLLRRVLGNIWMKITKKKEEDGFHQTILKSNVHSIPKLHLCIFYIPEFIEMKQKNPWLLLRTG